VIKISITLLFIFLQACDTKPPVNIYKSDEYNRFTEQDRIIGESIWATTCFRCHMYGSNGGKTLSEKDYWNEAAGKGFQALYKSVWEGKAGDEGVMPPKGLCNPCSEEEIKKSVLYLFQLAKKIQTSDSLKQVSKLNL
jgi:cytochrome c5|tara:strand:- start:2724 stop:3137 length:414 start_codon:yes stop_codon:yes gene_type:complete